MILCLVGLVIGYFIGMTMEATSLARFGTENVMVVFIAIADLTALILMRKNTPILRGLAIRCAICAAAIWMEAKTDFPVVLLLTVLFTASLFKTLTTDAIRQSRLVSDEKG